MASGELIDPLGYGVWWTVLAVALILLPLVWLFVARRIGRKANTPSTDTPTDESEAMDLSNLSDPYAKARRARLAELADIEQRLSVHELAPRAATVEIAAVLREFASVRRGVRTEPLTSAELRQLGWTGGTGELVAALLDPAFSAPGATEESAMTAVRRAQEVISQW